MKKILITFILPLFIFNNLMAQNNSAPHFDVYVHVSAPTECPNSGTVDGYAPEIGHSIAVYNGPGVYWLTWSSTLTYPQPVSVDVTTQTDANGYWCHDKKTEILSGEDWGYDFYMNLDLIAPSGGDEQ